MTQLKDNPLIKVPVKYGLIGSLFGIVIILLLFYTNKHPLLIPPFYDFRIVLFSLFIFFAAKEFRDYHNGGILNFWQGMIVSFIVYLLIGILVSLFIIVFANVVPEFLEAYITGTIEGLELNRPNLVTEEGITISGEEFERQIELLRQTNASMLAMDYVLKSCLIGFPLAIIISVILRRTEKRY